MEEQTSTTTPASPAADPGPGPSLPLEFADKAFGSFCDPDDLDSVLAVKAGSKLSLLRDVLQANGLGEQLETRPGRVTVFAPTDAALRKWMDAHGLQETDLYAPSWEVDNCVQHALRNLVHTSELKATRLARWVEMNQGEVSLPTVCGEACGSGLLVTRADSGALRIEQARIVTADIEWCKGVVHIIDEMPLPRDWIPGTQSCKSSGAATGLSESSGQLSGKLSSSFDVMPGASSKASAEDSVDATPWMAAISATVFAFGLLACLTMCYRRYLKLPAN
jgi:hypothetical protein